MEFINNITKNLPQEHAVAFRVGIVISVVLLLIIFIAIIFKIGKVLEKKKILIDFSFFDYLGAWCFVALGGFFYVIYLMITKGYDSKMIQPLIILLFFGILGAYYQKLRITSYKDEGFKGMGIILRWVLNFICGIMSIFFLYILVPYAIYRTVKSFVNSPISKEELQAIRDKQSYNVKDYTKADTPKRRVEFGFYTDEKGNSGLATTYHHSDRFSSTTYTDSDGEKHIVYHHKR